MTWAELFERAAAYGVDEAAVSEALADRRGDDDREQPPDDGREADGL